MAAGHLRSGVRETGGSSKRNRQAIAARETRVASRLRAIERAYRMAIDPDATPEHDPTKTPRSAAMAHDYDLELE